MAFLWLGMWLVGSQIPVQEGFNPTLTAWCHESSSVGTGKAPVVKDSPAVCNLACCQEHWQAGVHVPARSIMSPATRWCRYVSGIGRRGEDKTGQGERWWGWRDQAQEGDRTGGTGTTSSFLNPILQTQSSRACASYLSSICLSRTSPPPNHKVLPQLFPYPEDASATAPPPPPNHRMWWSPFWEGRIKLGCESAA